MNHRHILTCDHLRKCRFELRCGHCALGTLVFQSADDSSNSSPSIMKVVGFRRAGRKSPVPQQANGLKPGRRLQDVCKLAFPVV